MAMITADGLTCFEFETGPFFQRLDECGGVFFSKAKRNGFFEIFLNYAQRRHGRTKAFAKLVNKVCVLQHELECEVSGEIAL